MFPCQKPVTGQNGGLDNVWGDVSNDLIVEKIDQD